MPWSLISGNGIASTIVGYRSVSTGLERDSGVADVVVGPPLRRIQRSTAPTDRSNAATKPNALASDRRFPMDPTLGRWIHFVYSTRGLCCAPALLALRVERTSDLGSTSEFQQVENANLPVVGAIGVAGFQDGSRYRYEFGSRCRSPTRTSAMILPPTGPSCSPLYGASSASFRM